MNGSRKLIRDYAVPILMPAAGARSTSPANSFANRHGKRMEAPSEVKSRHDLELIM
jgi:hypothetical protein